MIQYPFCEVKKDYPQSHAKVLKKVRSNIESMDLGFRGKKSK